MKKTQLSVIQMLQLLITFAGTRQTITNLVLSFKNGIIALGDKVNQINAMAGPQALSIKGAGATKKTLRLLLCSITYGIIAAVKGYALSIGNDSLAGQMSKSVSALRRTKSTEIANVCQALLDIVSPLVASLGDWGITTATITAWQSAIDNYNAILNTPIQKKNDRKDETQTVATLIHEAMQIVYNTLDTSVAAYINNGNTDFYNQYHIYRRVTQATTVHTHLIATVVNELGEPYLDVTVTVDSFTHTNPNTGASTTYKAIAANTDIKGNADVSTFEPGPRTVTISGKSIITKTFPAIQFERGKTVTQAFTCAPAVSLPESTPENKTEEVK